MEYEGTHGRRCRLFDTARAKPAPLFEGHWTDVEAVAFLPDGNTLASSGSDRTIRLWDTVAMKQVDQVTAATRKIGKLAVSADGKTLAWSGNDGGIFLWDRSGPAGGTGKKSIRRIARHKDDRTETPDLAFSPDGKTLASWREQVILYDVVSGKPSQVFPKRGGSVTSAAFSRDGRTIGCIDNREAVFRKASTGNLLLQMEITNHEVGAVIPAPDGQLLIAYIFHNVLGPYRVSLWSRAGWQTFPRRYLFSEIPIPTGVSPDGKTLLGIAWESACLWEIATGAERCRFKGDGHIRAMAVSPDGERLATASADGTILIRDIYGRSRSPSSASRLNSSQLRNAWNDLTSRDAAVGFRAICALVRCPDQSVPFLKAHLHPVRADAWRMERLIACLDHDVFAERERATKELVILDHAAAPALRRILANKPPLEVRRRAERLLAQMEEPMPPPPVLRSIRAVEVLEHAGTPEARELLHALAQGAPAARLTKEARAAAERLERRPTDP